MLTAAQLIAAADEADRATSHAEAAHDADILIPSSTYGAGVPFPHKLAHCALFNVASTGTPRADNRLDFLPVSSGGYVEYDGPELRQDDESVLLYILGQLAGKGPTFPVTFDPRDLCIEMGWTTRRKDANVDRVITCLQRMLKAKLDYYAEGQHRPRWSTVIVSHVAYNDDESLTVTLSPTILEVYDGRAAFVSTKIRAALSEGLPTWLYSFVAANKGNGYPFDLDKLREWSGSRLKEKKEFTRAVRQAMTQIADKYTGLESWTIKDGRLYVFKKQRPAAK